MKTNRLDITKLRNLSHDNGGSGMHSYASDHVDFTGSTNQATATAGRQAGVVVTP